MRSLLAVLACIGIILTPNISFASIGTSSLSFSLVPWGDGPRPGGSVLLGSNPIFDADETTIEAWFKPESYPTGEGQDEGRTIIWNGDGTGGHDPYWILLNPDGVLEARVAYELPYQRRVIRSTGPLGLNTWHHFALAISVDETRLYVDGIQQPDTILNAGPACKGTNYLAIGRSMWHWNPYEGLIDEMRIWSVARTGEEIRENMWAGSVAGDEVDLISYWDFEQGTDPEVLYDLAANHIDGEIHGALWYEENAPSSTANYALDFGEVGDFNYVIVGSSPVFDADEITFEAWIKPTSLPTGTYIFEGRSTIAWNGDGSSGRDPYILYVNEFGKLEAHADFANGCSRFAFGCNVLTLDTWHHIALVISSTRIKLFLDGRKDGELSHSCGNLIKGHSYLAFARHMWYHNPFGGIMDEVRIWDTARTEEEIRDDRWAGCIKGDEAGLIGYWDFNEGDGQTLHDITQNQNHGTVYGATWTEDSAPCRGALTPIAFFTAYSGATDRTIRLEWPVPEGIPLASEYIVRYNTVPITEHNWDASLDVDGEPAPGPALGTDSMTIALPNAGALYYFAVKIRDPYLNMSAISNSACAKVSIRLFAGWNLIAFVNAYPMSVWQAMLAIEDEYTSVWRYDPATSGWLRYMKDGPDFLNNMAEMAPGYGYWVHVTETCVWDYGTVFVAETLSPSLTTRRPPFILYGTVMEDMECVDSSGISLKIGNVEAASYVLGSNPRYGDHYVLEIPVDGSFHEGDVARIYVNDVPIEHDPITLGGIGVIEQYNISWVLIPEITKLLQNYPNPFNPETWIPYQLADGSEVTIRIYSMTGQLVKYLDMGYKEAGSYMIKDTAAYWDGTTNMGEHVSSGIYFYSIQTGDYSAARKMLVVQ